LALIRRFLGFYDNFERYEISMHNFGRMDELESSEDLVKEEFIFFLGQGFDFILYNGVEIGLHELKYHISRL
jgi:hypothetical protein